MTPHPPALGPYVLPALRYDYADYAPAISMEVMRRHHLVHHGAAVAGVNAWLAAHPSWAGLTIEALLRRSGELPAADRAVLRDHAGAHANHQFLWKILSPRHQGGPDGELAGAIETQFGGAAALRARFEELASAHAQRGWAFLVCRPQRDYRLEVLFLADNGSVLTLPEPAPGLLVCDLWPHAYAPDSIEQRLQWVRTWWELIDWPYVAQRLSGIRAGRPVL